MIISQSLRIGIYWKLKTDQKTNFKTPISNSHFSRALSHYRKTITHHPILFNRINKRRLLAFTIASVIAFSFCKLSSSIQKFQVSEFQNCPEKNKGIEYK